MRRAMSWVYCEPKSRIITISRVTVISRRSLDTSTAPARSSVVRLGRRLARARHRQRRRAGASLLENHHRALPERVETTVETPSAAAEVVDALGNPRFVVGVSEG